MKFNKNEFGWKEKVSVNTDELVTKNDIPHYNEILMFEISGEDYNSFTNNSYFNMSALNIDETKLYVGEERYGEYDLYVYSFVYDKENGALIDEDSQLYIYNHKSYDGTNFVENENSAVLTYNIRPMSIEYEGDKYFKLYEVDKVELDNNCLSDNVSIKNSLTVGSRIGSVGECSVSEGVDTTASGYASHAEGSFTTASGSCSHVEGSSSDSATIIIQDLSSSTSNDVILTAWNENKFSLAKGTSSHVEGFNCLALDNYSHAEGNATQALYQASHAEGTNTVASDICSHAEGESTTASGGYSHAEGSITKATELYSHAEGNYSEASGNASHAEGYETIASGVYSHAEGYKCKSESNSSHAEGCLTEANNFYTHAEGFYTIAKGYSQHVQGKYNIEDTAGKYAHIVGNGESETERSNAHTLDWQGNGWYKGKVSIDGTPTEDKDLVTKKYVDDTIASQPQISFDESGNLVVTIGGVTKKFKEITE